jgi:glutaminase
MTQAASLLSLFAQSAVCQGLSKAEVEDLFALCEVRRYQPGQRLIEEHQPADALWVLLEGDVQVTSGGNLLAEVGPGAALGELSLFRKVPTRTATVTAMCPVMAIRISVPQFQKRLAQHDLAALKVVSNLAHQLAERLIALNEKLVHGGRKGLSVARSELRRVVGVGGG